MSDVHGIDRSMAAREARIFRAKPVQAIPVVQLETVQEIARAPVTEQALIDVLIPTVPQTYSLEDQISDAQRLLDVLYAQRDEQTAKLIAGFRPTCAHIQRLVASHFGVSVLDMISDRRTLLVTRPRQVAMYLCRHTTPLSMPCIGRLFGGRDHTTVLHAVRRVDKLRLTDASVREAVDLLFASLRPVAA